MRTLSHENRRASPRNGRAGHRVDAENFARYSLLLLVLGAGILFFNMIRVFLVPVVLAAVFVGLFYPFYQWVLIASRGRRGLSALICCLVLSIGMLLPAYGVANLVAREAMRLYQTAGPQTQAIFTSPGGIKGQIERHPWLQRLRLDEIRWQSSLEQVTKKAAELLATFINKASKETFELISNLFLTFFTMFYFFRDGPVLLGRLKYFSPLPAQYEDEMIRRFVSVSHATIKGTLMIGLIKGFLGGLTFWAFGIEAPVLWGVVMVVLSFLPVIGAWLVMYPAAFFLFIHGQIWQGLTLFLIAALVIGSIDNLLEPFLVARGSGMHDLLAFFSILGGIGMFGVMGFIVGPIIAALFRTLLDIYGIEFSKQLNLVHESTRAADRKAEFQI